MKCYRVRLKEWGIAVRYWGQVWAIDALSAINQVCIDGKPYQEWMASEVKFVALPLARIKDAS
jgi:hypothetical protein